MSTFYLLEDATTEGVFEIVNDVRAPGLSEDQKKQMGQAWADELVAKSKSLRQHPKGTITNFLTAINVPVDRSWPAATANPASIKPNATTAIFRVSDPVFAAVFRGLA